MEDFKKNESRYKSAYAVIFSNQRTGDENEEAYQLAAHRMVELAQTIPGYLGIESARGADGFGITVSYWESEKAIQNWREHAEHSEVRARGKSTWYLNYNLQVAKIERSYNWNKLESENE